MIRTFVAMVSVLLLTSGAATAQNCVGNYPNTLTNGQNADATQVMANFDYIRTCANGITASIDDTNRRNILLNSAFIAKLFGSYVRNVGTFADGYADSSGVNAGASSNYVVDAAAKLLRPSQAAGAAVATAALTADQGAGIWFNNTIRQFVNASQITSGSGPVTFTINSATTTPLVIGAAYIGQGASSGNQYAFAATPTQITFNSGNASTGTIAAGGSITSDPISFNVPASVNLVVSMWVSGSSGNDGVRVRSSLTGWQAYYLSGANDAATVAATGYTAAGNGVVALSAITRVGATNNMTVVTTAQTPDATVTRNRVLLEYAPGTTVINTDLTVDVTCNGTSWTAAALVAAGTAQAGRNLVETADTTCAAGGGSFAARLRTFNNKTVQIFKTTVTARP